MTFGFRGSDELPRRLGLIGIAAALLALASGSEIALWQSSVLGSYLAPRERVAETFYAALFSGIGLSLIILSVLPRLASWLNTYVFFVVLLTIGLGIGSGILKIDPYGSDNAAAIPYAAQLLLKGQNPYNTFVLADAVAQSGLPPEYVTRLQDGTQWTSYIYPAGSFLAVAPFLALGLSDLRFFYAACILAMIFFLYAHAAPQDRILLLAVVLSHHVFTKLFFAGGLPEPLWGLLVMGSWYYRRRVFLGAGLLGFAASAKQLGAFFLPFYAVYVFRTKGRRTAIISFCIGLGVFALTNLPFILGAPSEWFGSMVGVSMAPLPPQGTGLAILATEAGLGVPNAFYTLVSLVALIASLTSLFFVPKGSLGLAWVLPLVPLWFSLRSLSSYFYLIPLFAIATFLEIQQSESRVPAGAVAVGTNDLS